jgi:CRISPR-associated protein Cas5h
MGEVAYRQIGFSMDIVHFYLSGRFGHFLRAETNVSMPSYPIPPRTVILGLIGGILGLNKDTPQVALEPAHIAVKGKLPKRFWVANKFHQSLPTPLTYKIKKNAKGTDSEIKNQKILIQEWLFNPEYELWVALPEKYHNDFAERIKNRRWYFSPYLGISEHIADIKWLSNDIAEPLDDGEHLIETIFPSAAGEINTKYVLEMTLAIHFIRMPAKVNHDRMFTHKNYCFERNAREIPIHTDKAVMSGTKKIVFM